MLGKTFGLCVVFLLAGCATDYSKKTSDEIANNFTVVSSEFNSHDIYLGPSLLGSMDIFTQYDIKLVAVKDKSTGILTDTISFTWNYSRKSWLFFSSVVLPGPKALVTNMGSRKVNSCTVSSCSYTEVMSAVIPRAELLSVRSVGLRLRVSSAGGSADIFIPANYLEGYLVGVYSLTGLPPEG